MSPWIALLAAAGLAHAQATTMPRPRFEVASVKPCRPDDLPSGGGRAGGTGTSANDPGRLRLDCQTVDRLIRLAYIRFAGAKPVSQRTMNQPIDGSPGWLASERYTIDAKPESPQTTEMMRGPMLQALLEERFKLKIRHDNREVAIYALVLGKGGAKLASTRKGSCAAIDFANGPPPPLAPGQPPPCGSFLSGRNSGVETFNQTVAGLCMQFSAALDRDVVDRTGLAGAFDIHLDLSNADLFPWESAPASDAMIPPDPLSAITRAVQKLGLRLEPAKANGEFLAIDHVERPSAN